MVFCLVSVRSFSFIKLSLITNRRFSSVRFPKFVIRFTGVLFATCFAREYAVKTFAVTIETMVGFVGRFIDKTRECTSDLYIYTYI